MIIPNFRGKIIMEQIYVLEVFDKSTASLTDFLLFADHIDPAIHKTRIKHSNF